MKKRFIKNLYQILSFSLCALILILPILCMPLLANFTNKTANSLALYSTLIVILSFFFLGFYWIFQTVEIDEAGIKVYFLSKTLRDISWKQIESIRIGGVMKNPAFVIKISGQKDLNLDKRKAIKKALELYFISSNTRDDSLRQN